MLLMDRIIGLIFAEAIATPIPTATPWSSRVPTWGQGVDSAFEQACILRFSSNRKKKLQDFCFFSSTFCVCKLLVASRHARGTTSRQPPGGSSAGFRHTLIWLNTSVVGTAKFQPSQR